MDTIALTFGLIRDLATVWSPLVLPLAVIGTVGFFGTKMVRTARTNAQARAERRAAEAYRAPVVDITDRLANRTNIA